MAGQLLSSFCERKGSLHWIAVHKNIALAVVMLLIVSGSLVIGVSISGHGDAIKTFAEDIRFRDATERMYFFHDAMKMFKERPMIGWGGGGWQEAYRAYQSYLYNSNQVHGYYFQLMVETGILGLLSILGIWISFLYTAHRFYHGYKENATARFLVWTITIGAVFIGTHAIIDFDLSLSALALVLWTMFGFIRGMGIYTCTIDKEKKSKTYIPPNNTILVSVSVASIMIIFFMGTMVKADNYAKQAGIYLQGQNLDQSLFLYQKASSFNPLNADYHSSLARIYQWQGKFDEGINEEQKAIELSKYNASRYADLASLYVNEKKNNVESINSAEKALSLAPFQIQGYEFVARTYFIVGYNELTSGNKDNAKKNFEKAAGMPGQIEAKMATLNETERKLWNVAPLMTPTPAIKLSVGSAQYLLGHYAEADTNLKAALADEKVKGEASLWLAVLRNKQGRTVEAQNFLAQAQKLAPELAKQYEGLLGL